MIVLNLQNLLTAIFFKVTENYKIAQLNHYWTRSLEEWLIKKLRGYANKLANHNLDSFFNHEEILHCYDFVDTELWDEWGEVMLAVLFYGN